MSFSCRSSQHNSCQFPKGTSWDNSFQYLLRPNEKLWIKLLFKKTQFWNICEQIHSLELNGHSPHVTSGEWVGLKSADLEEQKSFLNNIFNLIGCLSNFLQMADPHNSFDNQESILPNFISSETKNFSVFRW